MVEYEFWDLTISRTTSRNAVCRMLTDAAEYQGWELARLRRDRSAAAAQDHPDATDARLSRAPRQAMSRKSSRTWQPNSSASTGTRSSTPWNRAVKSRSAGSLSGANP